MQFRFYILFMNCVLVFPLFSQTDTLKIVEVIGVKDSISKISLLNSTVPHYILNHKKLAELNVNDMGEALKFVPGVQIKDYGGIGGMRTISYRSLSSQHTSLVFDGVFSANAQTGSLNLNNFEIFGLEQIEMTTGQSLNQLSPASSYLYSNTLVLTSKLFSPPSQNFELNFYSMNSSLNFFQKGILLKTKLSKHFYTGIQTNYIFGKGNYHFNYQNGDSMYSGTRDNAEISEYRIRFLLGYQKNKIHLTAQSFYRKNDQELPGAIVLYNPYQEDKLWNTDFQQAFTMRYKTLKWEIGSNLFFSSNYTRYLNPNFQNYEGKLDNEYFQNNSGGGFMINRKWVNQLHVFGGNDIILSQLSGSQFNESPLRISSNSVVGFSKRIKKFNFQGNLSHQYINDQFQNQVKEFNKLSPFISLSWLLAHKKSIIRLRAYYKNAFRNPSFNDLYYNFIGNIDLKPENAELFNFGFTFSKKINKIHIESTIDAYQNYVDNKIIAIPTKNLFQWSMQNIGKTKSTGIDFSLILFYKIKNTGITASTNQSCNQSIDVTNRESSTYGHQIPYTPLYYSNYSFNVQHKTFQYNLNLLYSGYRFVLNENNATNYLQGFTDIQMGINKTFTFKNYHALDLKFSVLNLLGRNYEVIKSFPMPGRNYQFKITYQLKK